MATKSIFKKFPITNEEYRQLEKKFDSLCCFAAWQLKRKNSSNNCPEEFDDYVQDFREAMVTAGAYYKRQVYIQDCLAAASRAATDPFTRSVVDELKRLWADRKRHGASRQKFGDHQENILDRLVARLVPSAARPRRDRPLTIDKRFPRYCKNVIWNKQKAAGRKISRERSLRTGLVSLSQYDYFADSDSLAYLEPAHG
jgi:hypothetical protein